MQFPKIAKGTACGHLKILPLIDIAGLQQPIVAAGTGDELPGAHGPGRRTDIVQQITLRHRHILEILRQMVQLQLSLQPGEITFHALEPEVDLAAIVDGNGKFAVKTLPHLLLVKGHRLSTQGHMAGGGIIRHRHRLL